MRLLSAAAVLLLLSACAHAPAPSAVPVGGTGALAMAGKSPSAPIKAELAAFTAFEGRAVSAHNVKLSDGRGAAELRVPLPVDQKELLVHLYRLNPRPFEAAKWPDGLADRTCQHLAALYHFKFPKEAALDPAQIKAQMQTRCYVGDDGNPIAYESHLVGDTYQMFGKYTLDGKILKVDLETWE